MSQSFNYKGIAPNADAALLSMEQYLNQSQLSATLVELVKYRVAQINRCPTCLDTHSQNLVEKGESMQRLATLSAWRMTDFFSEQERAALLWAETLSQVSEIKPQERDQAFEIVKKHFTEKELVDLTMAVIAINSWNRLHIAFGITPTMTKQVKEVKAAS